MSELIPRLEKAARENYLLFMKQTAFSAGQVLMNKRSNFSQTLIDTDTKGLVTTADLASNKRIIDLIKQTYPEDGIVTEESEEIVGSRGLKFIVDPLDGTDNYVAGSPYFSVSLGLESNNLGIVSVVYAPALGVLYYAAREHGAYRESSGGDKRKLFLGVDSNLVNIISFAADFDLYNIQTADKIIDSARTILKPFRRRMFQSTALELCLLAENQIQAHVNNRPRRWDIAAGKLIVEEAGGTTDYIGVGDNKIFVAGHPSIYEKLVHSVKSATV